MPALLVTFLTGLLTPIIEKVLASMMLDLRITKLEEKQVKVEDGFTKLAAAKSDQEYDDALKSISDSWNF